MHRNAALQYVHCNTCTQIRALHALQYCNTAPQHVHCYTPHRQCFLDASAASGSASALRAMLEEIQMKRVEHIRAAGLLATFTNNIFDTEAMDLYMVCLV